MPENSKELVEQLQPRNDVHIKITLYIWHRMQKSQPSYIAKHGTVGHTEYTSLRRRNNMEATKLLQEQRL
jgi:hypothetical protein